MVLAAAPPYDERSRLACLLRRLVKDCQNEKDVPTKQPEALASPRLPASDGDPCRAGGAAGPEAEGPPPPVGLSRTLWRIRGPERFARLARSRKRCRVGPLEVRRAPGPGPGPAVAFAISRKVGPAVVRNRLRRRLRECLRQMEGLGPVDLLVRCEPAAAGLTYRELCRALTEALRRLGAGDGASSPPSRFG